MWRLTTFGGLSVERLEIKEGAQASTSLAATAQRRPLALLAVLAAAGDRGVCRDDLLLYFWPDSDVERARNALRQTLFRLRRDLGPGDPIVGNDELRLEPRVVTSDLAEFEAALTGGQLDDGVPLYRGPFLQGVSIGSAPEFDQWAAAERAKLAYRYAAALESLACTAEARGDHDAAIAWWRKLAATDPTNPRVAVGLMSALATSGDREGALQYYRLHEVLVQEQLGVRADDTVVALVEKLRSVREGVAPAPEVIPPPAAAVQAVTAESAGDSRAASVPPRPAAGSWQSQLRVALAVVATIAVVVVLSRAWASIGRKSDGEVGSPDVIAIFPFAARGDSGARDLGDAVTDLLGAALDGAGALRVADRHTLRESFDRAAVGRQDAVIAQALAAPHLAGTFVLGDVTATGGRVAVTATLYAHGSQPVKRSELAATGDRADLASVASELARQIVAANHSGPNDRLIQSAALTTRSLPALRAFLDGEHQFQHGNFAQAVEGFRRATTEDTTFAIAFYRLSIAADWASHPEFPVAALRRAVALAGRLSEHDQQLVRALDAWRGGRGAEAMSRYRSIVSQYPDDAEAWYQLGETIYHVGPSLGQSVLDARPTFERAAGFRAGARESLSHLIRLAAKAKDKRAVDTLVSHVIAMDTTKDATELRLFRALVVGNRDSVTRLMEVFRGSPDEAVLWAAIRAGVFAEDFAGATAISRLLMNPSRGVGYQAQGRWYVASLELAGGRWSAAKAMLAPTLTSPVPNGTPEATNDASDDTVGFRSGSIDALHIGQLGYMATLPLLPLSQAELIALRDRVAGWPEPPPVLADWSLALHPRLKDYVLGLLSARLGDTVTVRRHAARLEAMQHESDVGQIARGYALTLHAEVARLAGKPHEALGLIESAPVGGGLSSLTGARSYERFIRGELLRELGRDEEALRWYATQGQTIIPDLIYLAPAELRQAQIYEQRGERARATAHYRRFIELWKDAEPELQSLVDDARRRLRALGG